MLPEELAALRAANRDRGLRRADLDPDPMAQFLRWYDAWQAAGPYNAEAVAFASAALDGRPSVRFVLLRGHDDRGFVFYTNYDSRKGAELAANPQGALCFGWIDADRQVRAAGPVVRATDAEGDAYWQARPRGSQLAASISDQSQPIADRAALEQRYDEVEQRFADRPVDRPDHWGGFRLVPDEVEFWQARDNRLHDRFRYRRPTEHDPAGAVNRAGWIVERLMP